METYLIEKSKCHHCEYSWAPKTEKKPKACPKCKRRIDLQIELKTCFNCQKTFYALHHHHISYNPELIVAVCNSCHKNIHNDNTHLLYPADKNLSAITKRVIDKKEQICQKCNYVWRSFIIPKECPKCHTYKWNKQ